MRASCAAPVAASCWTPADACVCGDPTCDYGTVGFRSVDGEIIYAETPFLQPVHERAHDFTRFTRSGHRWLFRGFAELRAGTIGAPAESLLWSIRYLARGLFRGEKIGSLFAVAFFGLRYLDKLVDDRYRTDAATGVYFLGAKSAAETIAPRDLVTYFPGVRGG